MDIDPWNGIRCPVPDGVLRRLGGDVSALSRWARITRIKRCSVPEGLSRCDERVGLVSRAQWNLCGLPVVSGDTACGHRKPLGVSAKSCSCLTPIRLDGTRWGWSGRKPLRRHVPIAITMAALVVARYGSDLRNHPRLRSAVLGAVLFSFASSAVAGFWGAMIDKAAPVEGGHTIIVMGGATR